MLALSLLPILIIILISYTLNSSVMNQQTGRLVQANLEQSASNVENFWNTYDRLIQEIYTDSTYINLLQPINRWDSSEYQESVHQLEIELEHLIYSNPEILGIAILGSHYDCCFYDSITKSGQESICFDVNEFRKVRDCWNWSGKKERMITAAHSVCRNRDTRNGIVSILFINW